MFNVGDTVEWVDDDDGELKKGHRYTVSGQENECVFLAEAALGVHESCICLVKPAAAFTPLSLEIGSLARYVHQMACEKGWWEDGKRNFGELMALATSEISEAFEEYRNGHKPDEIYYGSNGKPEGVPVELADCIIRILDTCEAEGIPLERALREKIAYNATRPHRHGGKVC